MVLIAPHLLELASQFQYHMPMAVGVSLLFAPMVNAVPGELFAVWLDEIMGEQCLGRFAGVYDPETTDGNNIVTQGKRKVGFRALQRPGSRVGIRPAGQGTTPGTGLIHPSRATLRLPCIVTSNVEAVADMVP